MVLGCQKFSEHFKSKDHIQKVTVLKRLSGFIAFINHQLTLCMSSFTVQQGKHDCEYAQSEIDRPLSWRLHLKAYYYFLYYFGFLITNFLLKSPTKSPISNNIFFLFLSHRNVRFIKFSSDC